jgi:AraC-like DNA-binding protein
MLNHMERFRNKKQHNTVEPVYQLNGLTVEHIRRYDWAAHLPGIERWRSWSFRFTLGGTGYVEYQGQAYTLAPNTILWHSPLKEVVRTRGLSGAGSDMAILTFTPQRWSQFIEQHPLFRKRNAAWLDNYPKRPLLTPQLASPQVLFVLRQFMVFSQAPNISALALENCCTLLQRLVGDLRFDMNLQCQEDERRRRVELAQAQMVARLYQPSRLQQIAAGLSVSPRQLQRDFLACTGLTPMRYFNVVRLSEANRLLAETTIPIAEIAALLGYVSVTHFSAAFRQAYNCSPRQVREVRG